ncbi:hypothetical protein ABZ023_18475 [Streptomyces sp. NPDC006367]|uniref:hypothetical protein n=1 Tax=unclassified Streptomyces TaxID=2593676 RepID=UPI0033A3C88A
MEERDKLGPQLHRTAAAFDRAACQARAMNANVVLANAAFRKTLSIITAMEAQAVATHPDLAEWNVQMDAFYGDA